MRDDYLVIILIDVFPDSFKTIHKNKYLKFLPKILI